MTLLKEDVEVQGDNEVEVQMTWRDLAFEVRALEKRVRELEMVVNPVGMNDKGA